MYLFHENIQQYRSYADNDLVQTPVVTTTLGVIPSDPNKRSDSLSGCYGLRFNNFEGSDNSRVGAFSREISQF